MADEEVVSEEEPTEATEDEPTETELLQEIINDIRYLLKCTVPNSIYKDFEYPSDGEGE